MKRPWSILVLGIVLAVLAYGGFYWAGTANLHSLEQAQEPELLWLKKEFRLGDAEFDRICKLHESYYAACAERCRKIDEKNRHLSHLLASTNSLTPEMELAISDAAQLRAECQKEMLRHFYEVSQTMPAEQGRRYLAWVHGRTIGTDSHSQMQH